MTLEARVKQCCCVSSGTVDTEGAPSTAVGGRVQVLHAARGTYVHHLIKLECACMGTV